MTGRSAARMTTEQQMWFFSLLVSRLCASADRMQTRLTRMLKMTGKLPPFLLMSGLGGIVFFAGIGATLPFAFAFGWFLVMFLASLHRNPDSLKPFNVTLPTEGEINDDFHFIAFGFAPLVGWMMMAVMTQWLARGAS